MMQNLLKTDRQAADWGILFAVGVCIAIIALGGYLTQFPLATEDPTAPDMFLGFFYQWQLANPTILSRLTAWVAFAVHTLLIWMTIYWAVEKSPRTYTDRLKPVNYVALGINALFIVLHYLQTAVFYDGLAQDVPSWTAQFTVIMMLFIIIAIENRRRGMFFGKKVPFRKEFYRWLRDYHGYAFSFAVIYTFWFHPMVFTWGHLVGFLHVMLVMVQGSLMFTRMHLNRKWILILELLVLPHSAIIAMTQANSLAYMFVFGFMSIFIVTQMHTLRLKTWVKNLIYLGFVATLLYVYLFVRQPYQINEVIRIPLIDYLMIFMTYGLWLLFARLTGRVDSLRVEEPAPPMPVAGD
ncbi:hypothetical protein G4Y79_07640 [Phototrophicus methaneseepsis]|uniref:Uncharacterized protein n=1 Tax=Phototrophicus methaneseepsis TaxID=2710758 RepID=A0A7S8EC25_9CHLR|nr:hypothetical protein [Phototrophicus methaneseepsis]QPC84235.1 hypothetical protein G4Y79_07640 [Phototrophicus methaneseepsis]